MMSEQDLRTEAEALNDQLEQAIRSAQYREEQYQIISQVIGFIRRQTNIVNELDLTRVVLLMGPTGVGKSTLVNFIAGQTLYYERLEGRRVLRPLQPIVRVGNGRGSTTLIPNIWESTIPGLEDVIFIDCAGEFDASGVVLEVINSYIKSSFARNAREAKIVLVGSQLSLGPAGGYGVIFRDGMSASSSFLGNINDFIDSIALIVSHSEREEDVIEDIRQNLSDILGQRGQLGDYRDAIQHVLDRNRVINFPKAEGLNREYTLPIGMENLRQQIIELIGDRINFGVVDRGRHFRIAPSQSVIRVMSRAAGKVKEKASRVLQGIVTEGMRPKLRVDISQLEEFKGYLEQIISRTQEGESLTLREYIEGFNRDRRLPRLELTRELAEISDELDFIAPFTASQEAEQSRASRANWGQMINMPGTLTPLIRKLALSLVMLRLHMKELVES